MKQMERGCRLRDDGEILHVDGSNNKMKGLEKQSNRSRRLAFGGRPRRTLRARRWRWPKVLNVEMVRAIPLKLSILAKDSANAIPIGRLLNPFPSERNNSIDKYCHLRVKVSAWVGQGSKGKGIDRWCVLLGMRAMTMADWRALNGVSTACVTSAP